MQRRYYSDGAIFDPRTERNFKPIVFPDSGERRIN